MLAHNLDLDEITVVYTDRLDLPQSRSSAIWEVFFILAMELNKIISKGPIDRLIVEMVPIWGLILLERS